MCQLVNKKCSTTQTHSAMFCMVRAAHKFYFTLVTEETSNKWRPVQRQHSDRYSCVWQDLYVFPPTVVAGVRPKLWRSTTFSLGTNSTKIPAFLRNVLPPSKEQYARKVWTTMQTKTARSCVTPIPTYQSTRRYASLDPNLHQLHSNNFNPSRNFNLQ